MYLLAQVYSVLAFAETMVLFASVLGLLVLGLRLTVRGLNILIDAAIDFERARCGLARPKTQSP